MAWLGNSRRRKDRDRDRDTMAEGAEGAKLCQTIGGGPIK